MNTLGENVTRDPWTRSRTARASARRSAVPVCSIGGANYPPSGHTEVYCSVVASDRFQPGQVVTVFRSRLRPENEASYTEEAARMHSLAVTMPGLVDVKAFTSEDGERLTLVTFSDQATHEAWRQQADHLVAQSRGRAEFYAEYSLQVCSTVRVRSFGSTADGRQSS
jgi:heme-degrading monooxygenase HmoA